jgi:sulfane dehydrogenase subunit SoxC
MADKITRRGFVKAGMAASAGLAGTSAVAQGDPKITKVQKWAQELGEGLDTRPYGLPSPYETGVVRRRVPWLTADATSSINFTPIHDLEGIITPNGVCFERHHAGVPQYDPADHRLMINGLVEQSLVLSMADILRFPRENRVHFLECAANSGMEWRGPQMDGAQFTHGMIHNVMYTGVPLRLILQEAGIKAAGKWVLAEGGDASGLSRSIPMEKALDDCLVAFKMNGEALRPENGYPLRLVVPGWEGITWIKWLRRLEVGDKPWHQREETSKYTDLLADGSARRFSWVMDAKSVITSPSPQMPITHGPGQTVISGLAWSGHGTIPRVDVSLDGGVNWHPARMSGPSLDKSMHRFYFDFVWDGKPLLLQSRAQDSTGYVQPTKDVLRRYRGESSTYHNNGIQTWAVNEQGEVQNVEVS